MQGTEPAALTPFTEEQAAARGRPEARWVIPLDPEPGVADFQPTTLSATPNRLLPCVLQTWPFRNRNCHNKDRGEGRVRERREGGREETGTG